MNRKPKLRNLYIFLFTFVMTISVITGNAKELSDAEFQDRYEQAIKEQDESELRVQYSGDDEMIRKRLNLPPKIGAFEEWKVQQQLIEQQAQKSKEISNDAVVTPQPISTALKSDESPIKNDKINLFLILYLIMISVLWFLKRNSTLFKIIYWLVGFPFAVLGLFFGSSANESNQSDQTNKDKRNNKSSPKKEKELRESVEIQFQEKSGGWRTLHVTRNNQDQTISHGMDDVEHRISKMSSATGGVRAKGKVTGTIYDIRH